MCSEKIISDVSATTLIRKFQIKIASVGILVCVQHQLG